MINISHTGVRATEWVYFKINLSPGWTFCIKYNSPSEKVLSSRVYTGIKNNIIMIIMAISNPTGAIYLFFNIIN
jgi:hypothetical protein